MGFEGLPPACGSGDRAALGWLMADVSLELEQIQFLRSDLHELWHRLIAGANWVPAISRYHKQLLRLF